jgi:hypothetical protein
LPAGRIRQIYAGQVADKFTLGFGGTLLDAHFLNAPAAPPPPEVIAAKRASGSAARAACGRPLRFSKPSRARGSSPSRPARVCSRWT